MPSLQDLQEALQIAEQIEQLESRFQSILGVGESVQSWETGNGKQKELAPKLTKPNGRKPFSAVSRPKMAATQKARWAKKNGAATAVAKEAEKPAKKTRRVLSPEAREKIAAAQKARWAKQKGSAAKAGTPAAKPVKKKPLVSPVVQARLAAAEKARKAAAKAAKVTATQETE